MKKALVITLVSALLHAGAAYAGVAFMDFDDSVGLLTYGVGGASTLTSSGGRASFTGAGVTVLAQDGSPIQARQTNTMIMHLRPATDVPAGGNYVGIIVIDANDATNYVEAAVQQDAYVTLRNDDGFYQNAGPGYPSALNNIEVVDDRYTGRTTVTLNKGTSSEDSVFLEDSLQGAARVMVGVVSSSTGGFETWQASGVDIPDYPPGDSDGDGVTDDDEIEAGTDPYDPGSVPVRNSTGGTVNDGRGTILSIPAGSLPADTVNIEVSRTSVVPDGPAPGGLSPALYSGRHFEPSGLNFSEPVTVTMSYSGTDMISFDESTFQAAYWTGSEYSTSGIVSSPPDTSAKTVSFTTDHFTLFTFIGQPAGPVRSATPWGIGAAIVFILGVSLWISRKSRTRTREDETPSGERPPDAEEK